MLLLCFAPVKHDDALTTQWDSLLTSYPPSEILNVPASATATHMLMSSRLVVLRMRNTVLQR